MKSWINWIKSESNKVSLPRTVLVRAEKKTILFNWVEKGVG